MTSAGRPAGTVPGQHVPTNAAPAGPQARDLGAATPGRAAGVETKPAFKTTELFVFLAGVVAIVITAVTVDGDASTGGDPFNAEQALRYITFLAIGYMISRGLAKAGARQRGDDRR
ncbi:hypothetical protein [Amycolatopsis rifamycinica]|uniref:hypothetical protein n=1 Tax=Amycolatopsis rifamycinica TaxID=287986 RepID=UPI0005C15CB2|nr:hypothetical protein [Amycolatopsis rifamycinica]